MSGCFISLRALVSASLPHAVMADCAPAPWSEFNDVEDQLLQSLPQPGLPDAVGHRAAQQHLSAAAADLHRG